MANDHIPGRCSMICVSYNHETFAEAALQSIFQQDYPDIEIIIVDDGSTDQTVQVLEKALSESPFPSDLIAQENTGNVGLNCNRALDRARGEFIGFLSFDDILVSGSISKKIALLHPDPNLAFVASTRNLEIDANGTVLDENHLSPAYKTKVSDPVALLDLEYEQLGAFYAQAGIYRASVLQAIGWFDEDMIGDDIVLRTKLLRYLIEHPEQSFALTSEPGFGYRTHGHNLHGKTWRQIKTVIEWRNRYFPERPLPALAKGWIEHFLKKCAKQGDTESLRTALTYDEQIALHYESYRKSWKYRRAKVRGALKRGFGKA